MLSTLIALSSLTFAQVSGGPNAGQGESVFSKPEARNPEVLQDRSIFQYLNQGEEVGTRPYSHSDWSSLKAVAPLASATKLKVLMLVFERDFTNPAVSNTLELSDKQRLVLAMSRIRSFFSSITTGELDVEVVPKFVPEPILDEYEAMMLLDKEFNRAKFDADDREERGPFAAILPVTGSRDSISFAKNFCDLGGSNPEDDFEQDLIREICRSLGKNISSRLFGGEEVRVFTSPSQWPTLRAGVPLPLLDPANRADTSFATAGSAGFGPRVTPPLPSVHSAIWGPITLAGNDGVLTYTESSILRGGIADLPGAPQGILEFKVRTKSSNPLGFRFFSKQAEGTLSQQGGLEEVTIGPNAQIPITPDGTWQTVRIGNPNGASHGNFGVPFSQKGVTRNPHEVIKYEFKEFRLVTEAPTPLATLKSWKLDTVEGVAECLVSGPTQQKRLALKQILLSPAPYKSLQPKLLEMSTELEPAVAFAAVAAYGKLGIANDDLIGKTFMNRLVSTAPNEYAREAALLYFVEHPEQTTFEAISPNIVRRSWRTRIATVKALAALDRTNLKAKPAARQLLLTACGQDMAIIRSAALATLKPDVEAERKQLEYSLVNDPSEQVRLQCLKQLGEANAPKEVLFGALADDSPYVREHVYEQLPQSLKREALQRMVIDRDTYVRAAALYGFAKLPDPTQPGEIQNTFSEEHPAVLLALVEGAQKGKWKLPANVIDNAKKSRSPLVKEGIAKLEGK